MTSRPGRLVLLGHPVGHSLSPRFQNAALRKAGIDLTYEALDVAPLELPAMLSRLASENAAGNVTIPHKGAAFAACARRTHVAERAGAVNTFWHEHGRLVGDNTDVAGFSTAVAQLLGAEPQELVVGLLGAGGAAAAVLAAIEEWRGCRAIVWNRTAERGARLCARFSSVAQQGDVARIGREAQLVVNATSIGLHDESLPMDVSKLRADAAVVDLVYRPGQSAFVRAARAGGHRATDGLAMLIEQGALAFERWFGVPPDRDAMWAAVR